MKFIVTAMLAFSPLAFGQNQTPEFWQIEKQRLEEDVKTRTELELSIMWFQNLAGGTVACGLSHSLVFASLVADTVPVANVVPELLANWADEDYHSLAASSFYDEAVNAVEGLFAGTGALVRDGLQFLILAWSGEMDRAWQNVAKSYESTSTLAKKLNQDKALCTRMSRSEMIIRLELFSRWGTNPTPDQLKPIEDLQ